MASTPDSGPTDLAAATPDGTACGHLMLPAGAGPCPLVVFFVDGGGVRASMFEVAAPLVDAGYAVVMADPYWRQRPFAPFDVRTVFTDPDERARLMKMISAVVPAQWIADAEALVAAIADPRVRTDRVAAVGYCMGGRTTFLMAALRPERVVAAAPIHAGGLVNDKPDSPHRRAGDIRAAMYLAVADEDASCTPEHQGAIAAALGAAHVRYHMELHAGARHGFAVSDTAVHDAAAATRHRERVLALFREHLPPA